jgi:hypothetical protein
MKTAPTWLAAALFAAGLGSSAAAASEAFPSPDEARVVVDGQWIAKAADNICGLRDPRTLSSPAKVDFKKLLDATPEMKKLSRDGIDKNSPEGIQLTQKAIDRLTQASKTVMSEKGHCSVWKEIKNSDERSVPDITNAVLQKF